MSETYRDVTEALPEEAAWISFRAWVARHDLELERIAPSDVRIKHWHHSGDNSVRIITVGIAERLIVGEGR